MKPFDINKLMRRIKRATGDGKYYTTGWDNEDYLEVINDEALSIISKYIRPYITMDIDLSPHNRVTEDGNQYYIDMHKLIASGLSIRDIKPYDSNINNLYVDWDFFSYMGSTSDMINGTIAAEAQATYSSDPRFKFIEPNILQIDSYNVSGLTGEYKFAFYVDMILTAIPPQVEEVFTKVAICKVKEALFDSMDMIKNLNTPNGVVNLPIDKWSDMKSELEIIETELKQDRIDNEFFIAIM